MSADIDSFLDGYSTEVSALAGELRNFVCTTAPDCSETLHVRWKVISYGYRKKFCAIAPHMQWVNLQFHNGAALEDPSGLLEGTGKAMRHVKGQDVAALNDDLRRLIAQAVGH